MQLSQEALAKRAGISRALVSDIEQGRANVTLGVIERLAIALGASVPDMLTSVQVGTTDADIDRRSADGAEAFVDARNFLAALDDQPAASESARYSKRGRKPAVPA